MKDIWKDLPLIYLHTGEFYLSDKAEVVATVLGSCISIIMFNERLKISAISHCLLPSCKNDGTTCTKCDQGFKYVDCSIIRMLNEFTKLKVKKHEIEVKIFGGADVLGSEMREDSVGKQNIIKAIQTLNKERIKITSSDVGGLKGRKLYLVTHTGEVFINKLKEQSAVKN
jgi:chemotaxis protein CheD